MTHNEVNSEQALATTEQRGVQPLVVTPQYVQQTKQSIMLLRDMVNTVLQEGVDYGKVPGTPKFLWEPGANTIISSFNCHAGSRRVLHLVDTTEKISVVIEVPVVSNQTGMEVATGIAAASTNEVKHKYRWIKEADLELWGYNENMVAGLRTREDYGHLEYRIPNPERSELLNVMVKQASKRAEVDAAEALPGVSGALRQLFDKRRQGTEGKAGGATRSTTQDWNSFWGQARALGLSADQVKEKLGIKSMKDDWLATGKTLDDAIRVLSGNLANTGGQTTKPSSPQKPTKQPRPSWEWDMIIPDDIKNYKMLEDLFTSLTGRAKSVMYADLGGKSSNDMTVPASEAFQTLKAIYYSPQDQPPEELDDFDRTFDE